MDESTPNTKDLATKYVPIGSFYAIFVGSLYLWAYWTTFRVDILEYIALSDIVKSAALPLLVVSIGLVIGALAGHVRSLKKSVPTVTDAIAKFGLDGFLKRKRRASIFLGLGAVTWAALTVIAFFAASSIGWSMMMFATILPLAMAAERLGLLEDLVVDQNSRRTALLLLAALPGIALAVGKVNAQILSSGLVFDYVVVPSDGDGVPSEEVILKRQRFLGHAGDFLFLWNPSNTALTITKFDAKTPLVLMRSGRPIAPPKWLPSVFVVARPTVASGLSGASAATTPIPASCVPVRASAPSATASR